MKRFLHYITLSILVLIFLFSPTFAWTNQTGQWAAGTTPLFTSFPLDFLSFSLLFSLLFFSIRFFLLKFRPTPSSLPSTAPSPCSHLFALPCLSLLLLTLLLSTQIFCLCAAWPVTIGRMAQGIDHPAFLFRLHEFFHVFPFALGSFNPWWNAGIEHFIGVTSGAHSFGILMSPFLLFLPIETAHSAALVFWLIFGFPYLTFFAFRHAGMRSSSALIGALLLFSFTRSEFLFFWQSGNLGSMITALLSPSVFALAYRITIQRRGSLLDVLWLSFSAWLACLWTPGVLSCAALVFSLFFLRKRQTHRSFSQILLAIFFTLLLLSPWIWTTLFPARAIVNFVTDTSSNLPTFSKIKIGLIEYSRHIQEWHPALISFGLFGASFCLGPKIRRLCLPLILFLSAIVCSIAFIPQSQFSRLTIQLAAAMVFPASIWMGRLLSSSFIAIFSIQSHPRFRTSLPAFLSAAFCFSSLLFGGLIAYQHFSNQAGFKLWPANACVYEYASWIHDNVPPEGRMAFAGLTDCKIEWAKPTYLPILSQREMMSDDYYGYPKGLTERNYPPKKYRSSLDAFLFFSDSYAITHWGVTDSRNKKFFDSHPNEFECVDYRTFQSTHLYTYRRRSSSPPSRCFLGNATISASENTILVTPLHSNTNTTIVIRYNWRPGLYTPTPNTSLLPFKVDDAISFIAIQTENPSSPIKIKYSPSWKPLQPNPDGTIHH